MRARRISLAIGLLLVPVLIMGGLACGSKKANPFSTTGGGIGPGDPAPFADGVWELRSTITATAGDPSCADANGSSVDTFTVAGGDVDGFIVSNCSFIVRGAHFSQTCRDTFAYSTSCRFVVTLSGSGEVDGDTFTAAYTATVAPLGDCSLFPVPTCTLRITATGSRIAMPIAARSFTISRGVRVLSVPEAIERLAVGRALEPVRRAMASR